MGAEVDTILFCIHYELVRQAEFSQTMTIYGWLLEGWDHTDPVILPPHISVPKSQNDKYK